ncbi:hypothetical protein RRG08_013843 [Elysia crispata]|uniref:Uncharacterized protein n=1 Tax=Elysia crispata TaxID=231223 RepID=A0AAE1D707_9GAST|nr:hypothetical protein RRG08_013843 [Elysia crispata]
MNVVCRCPLQDFTRDGKTLRAASCGQTAVGASTIVVNRLQQDYSRLSLVPCGWQMNIPCRWRAGCLNPCIRCKLQNSWSYRLHYQELSTLRRFAFH